MGCKNSKNKHQPDRRREPLSKDKNKTSDSIKIKSGDDVTTMIAYSHTDKREEEKDNFLDDVLGKFEENVVNVQQISTLKNYWVTDEEVIMTSSLGNGGFGDFEKYFPIVNGYPRSMDENVTFLSDYSIKKEHEILLEEMFKKLRNVKMNIDIDLSNSLIVDIFGD